MGIPTDSMLACGGGGRSPLWRSILADLYGCPVQTAKAADEGPALGAAILAGVGAGVFPSVEEACDSIVKPDSVSYPDGERAARYRPFYQLYAGLYPALRDSFDKLSRLS